MVQSKVWKIFAIGIGGMAMQDIFAKKVSVQDGLHHAAAQIDALLARTP